MGAEGHGASAVEVAREVIERCLARVRQLDYGVGRVGRSSTGKSRIGLVGTAQRDVDAIWEG